MTTMGRIEVEADYGYDPEQKRWRCPLREALWLGPCEMVTPELRERLCHTATQARSYEAAAEVARVWGAPADASTIWRHAQAVGQQRRESEAERIDEALEPSTRDRVVSQAKQEHGGQDFSLIVMMDAWKIRERGEQWGLKPADDEVKRVAWRDEKSAIVFRLDHRGQSDSGRPVISEKRYEAWRGDPHEFGRRVYALALRQGLMQAQHVYVVADGGVWIWNIAGERFAEATEVLDFYHASEHLWAVAHALCDDDDQARAWVEPLLHQLRHGDEASVIDTLDGLGPVTAGQGQDRGETVRLGREYFHSHRDRIHYQRVAATGCPVGSGAMESTCSQFQDRFKRTGQFWVWSGHSNLMAIELARRNGQWQDLWLSVA